MEAYLPLFPLNLVAFPGETLNLHIFEDRYKELIGDCLEHEAPFGLPAYVENQVEYGTEVQLVEVVERYDDGRLEHQHAGRAGIPGGVVRQPGAR